MKSLNKDFVRALHKVFDAGVSEALRGDMLPLLVVLQQQ